MNKNEISKSFDLSIAAHSDNAISCKGSYYIRSGSNTMKLTGHALDEFLLRKQNQKMTKEIAKEMTKEI